MRLDYEFIFKFISKDICIFISVPLMIDEIGCSIFFTNFPIRENCFYEIIFDTFTDDTKFRFMWMANFHLWIFE